MISTPATVSVEYQASLPAIRMTWQHRVEERDVRAAFRTITNLLNQIGTPTYVLVDLQANPIFPLKVTLESALFGPYRDNRLEAWLVVNGNTLARSIELTLRSVTGRYNVYWFENEDKALAYLRKQQSAPVTSSAIHI